MKVNELFNLKGKTAIVTGGGRGGYMLALTPGKDLQDRVASAFEERGVPTIRATIGGAPTDGRAFEILR